MKPNIIDTTTSLPITGKEAFVEAIEIIIGTMEEATVTPTVTPSSTNSSTEPISSKNTTATTATTTVITLAARTAESAVSSPANGTTAKTETVDTDQSASHKPMSIETTASDNDDHQSSSSAPLSSSVATSTSANDDGDADIPKALQNLALAATSDLLEISPRALEFETPKSQAGTPSARGDDTTTPTSENPEPKPKGILRKPKYLPSNVNVKDTAGANTIFSTNERRKRRSFFNFFESSEIDRLGKAMKNTYGFNIDEEYDDEINSGSTLMTFFWSLVLLPVIVLSYDEFPYLFVVCLLWMARWFHRLLLEEISMQRNSDDLCSGSLNEAARTKRYAPAPLVPSSGSNLPSEAAAILSEASPVVGIRTTRVRFQEGMKFPMRKLLRQPIRRIPKHNLNATNNRTPDYRNTPPPRAKKTLQPFVFGLPEEQNGADGDPAWSLDSLMVLRNYMQDNDHSKTNRNNNAANEPTPLSVMAPQYPPPQHTETVAATTAATNDDEASKDSQDPNDEQNSADEGEPAENNVVPEPEPRPSSAGDRCRRDSVVFFPQDDVEEEDIAYESRYGHSFQPVIQLEDDEDEEKKIDGFHDGLFGKNPSNGDATKEASRYRRRKPRDSLCFTTLARKTNVPELLCPIIIPQCPSDELEYLELKMQEKSDRAVVVEQPPPREEEQLVESSSSEEASVGEPSFLSVSVSPTSSVSGEDSSVEITNKDPALASDVDGCNHGDGQITDRDVTKCENDEETETLAQILAEETPSVINDNSQSFSEEQELPSEEESSLANNVGIADDVVPGMSNHTIVADSSGRDDGVLQFINPFLSESLSDDYQEIPMLDEESSLSGSTDESVPYFKPGSSRHVEDEISGSFDLPTTIINDLKAFSLNLNDADSESTANGLDPIVSLRSDEDDDPLSHNELLEIIMNEEETDSVETVDNEVPQSDDDLPEILADGESSPCVPHLTDLQMISFDSNDYDNIECILSPRAFEISEEETMYRRDFRSMHIPLVDDNAAKLHDKDSESPSQAKEISSLPDVDCIISPLPLVRAHNSKVIDAEARGDSTNATPSSPKAEDDKENSDDPKTMNFEARLDKALVDSNSTSAKTCENVGSSLLSTIVQSMRRSPTA